MMKVKKEMLLKILESEKQVERIFTGFVLILSNSDGELYSKDCDFNLKAETIEDKKKEIIKIFDDFLFDKSHC
jgi:hypothetical protein